MSHVVQIKTKLDNLNLIKEALKFMNLSYKENSSVRMWAGATKEAELVITMPSYDIGVNKDASTGNYTLVCDHYAWGEASRHKSLSKYPKNKISSADGFTGILTQATNIIKAQLIASSQGDNIEISDPDKNGVIHAQVIQQAA